MPTTPRFDLDRFVADCRAALADPQPQKAMRAVVAEAIASPAAVMATLGEPRRAELQKLYVSPELTVLNLIWAPGMRFIPHNHGMWATIGIYDGQEDNVFWRRLPGPSGDLDAQGRIESAGGKRLETGDVTTLGQDIIHSVTNPSPRFTSALHVYAGDFFAAKRSEWDAEALTERPYDTAAAVRAFENANAKVSLAD
jgi:predicted metal-dependent enzyme (double-stranded beta helix superfamily)